jgi:hypothetical protein
MYLYYAYPAALNPSTLKKDDCEISIEKVSDYIKPKCIQSRHFGCSNSTATGHNPLSITIQYMLDCSNSYLF